MIAQNQNYREIDPLDSHFGDILVRTECKLVQHLGTTWVAHG